MPPAALMSSTACFDAVLELGAEGGVRARDRAGDAHLDLGIGHAREGQAAPSAMPLNSSFFM
jgi:hypothetical protein